MRTAQYYYYNIDQPRTGHEGADGEYRYRSTISLTSILDVVNGQLPAPADLPLAKDPVPTVQKAAWAPRSFWTCAEILAPTGILSPDQSSRSESL
jgi:hypothetical protein